MADFCTQCTAELLREEGHSGDFVGLSTAEDTEAGRFTTVRCEGCGVIDVDHTGRCVSAHTADPRIGGGPLCSCLDNECCPDIVAGFRCRKQVENRRE